jgi:hypothetical protein
MDSISSDCRSLPVLIVVEHQHLSALFNSTETFVLGLHAESFNAFTC